LAPGLHGRHAGSRPVEFGIAFGTLGVEWDRLLEMWRLADELGFADGWVPDHLYGYFADPSAPTFEAWSVLAAVAASTRRIRLGANVSGNTFRHPALLANMAATIDHVSHGRLEIGLGAGWMESEHQAYGIPLPPPRERLDRLDEAVQVIKLLFTQERSTFQGRYYQLEDALCEPKPLQKPHPPLMIGGRGEKRTLRIVARHADRWNGDFVINLERKIGVLHEHCRTIGRDPTEIAISAVQRPEAEFDKNYRALVYPDDPSVDPRERRRAGASGTGREVEAERVRLQAQGYSGPDLDERLRAAVAEAFLPRDEARAIDHLNRLASLGVRHFIILHRPPYDVAYLERFMTQVAPRIHA
jgi:F420-dependent oxidoreductase-like protein